MSGRPMSILGVKRAFVGLLLAIVTVSAAARAAGQSAATTRPGTVIIAVRDLSGLAIVAADVVLELAPEKTITAVANDQGEAMLTAVPPARTRSQLRRLASSQPRSR